jgi:hypothetical protein
VDSRVSSRVNSWEALSIYHPHFNSARLNLSSSWQGINRLPTCVLVFSGRLIVSISGCSTFQVRVFENPGYTGRARVPNCSTSVPECCRRGQGVSWRYNVEALGVWVGEREGEEALRRREKEKMTSANDASATSLTTSAPLAPTSTAAHIPTTPGSGRSSAPKVQMDVPADQISRLIPKAKAYPRVVILVRENQVKARRPKPRHPPYCTSNNSTLPFTVTPSLGCICQRFGLPLKP